MKRLPLSLAALMFPCLPAPAAEPPKLDGVWEGWVVEGKGDNPNRGQIHLALTIDGDKITSKQLPGGGGGPGGGRGGGGGGGDLGTGTYKIVEAGKFIQMDATRTGGGGGGRPGGGNRPGAGGGRPGGGGGGVNQGIMALEGDTLKWCVANRGGRPADFETNRAKGQFLLILTKQKPKEDAPKDGTPKDAPKN